MLGAIKWSQGGSMLHLNSNGVLPPGVHNASLQEVKEAFGQFQETDRRPKLFEKLGELAEQLGPLEFVDHLIVNGSFITAKPDPEDIDLIVAIDPDILSKKEWLPVEYNALSSRRLRRRYQFDVLVAPAGGTAYDEYVALFSEVKGSPAGQKGLVRLQL